MAGGALARAQKKAIDDGYTIVWGDESAFYLLPHAVGTWAPRGKTPSLRVKLSKDHLSAISGVTLDGRLFLQVREQSYDSYAVVGASRVSSYANSVARSSSSGTARRSIADNQ